MTEKLFYELDKIEKEYKILENQLYNITTQKNNFIHMSKKYAYLKKIVNMHNKYKNIIKEINDAKSILEDQDKQMKDFIFQEIDILEKKKSNLIHNLEKIIYPDEEYVDRNVFLEIRAATGGSESAIFVEDLFKMYSKYISNKSWKIEILNYSCSNSGGYKEIVFKIIGKNILKKLKNESGVHRVQRIPKTESQGRIHTSTCSVAVLPEIKKIDNININTNDIRMDTYRASGAGGQHVNMTDSAVRIVHLPTGITAECQSERSQHKNKEKALSLLKSRMLTEKKNKIKNDLDNKRKNLVGSGNRPEKIRTYNYIENRITDHRIKITIYKLFNVLNGDLDLIINHFK